MTSIAAGNITRDSGASCGHLTVPLGLVQRSVGNGAMTSGSANLDSATANWLASDVGRLVAVDDAGPGGGVLVATIISRTSATRVVLSQSASATVSSKLVQILHYRDASDFAMTSGSPVITSASIGFINGRPDEPNTDIGRRIAVAGAGAAGAVLVATIQSVQSPTQATLSANASTTVSNAVARIARTFRARVHTSVFDEPISAEDVVSLIQIWGKLAQQDGRTIAQMEGQTIVAQVP